MSQDPKDLPPRRPKPRPRPRPEPTEAIEEPTTFRPAPGAGIPPKNPERPGARKRPARSTAINGDEPKVPRSAKPRRSISDDPTISAADRGGSLVERVRFGRVNSGLLATFCRQFSVYLNSGVGLTRALDSLADQYRGTALGPVVDRLGVAVRRGETVSEAASREPQAFDALFLSMMRVAEARGGMPETLRSLSSHYESRERLVRQARSAMIYPSAVILISLAVGGLLTIFVLPVLVEILRDFTRGKGVELPLPTRILIAISDFIQAYGWWLLPALLIGGGFALLRAYKTPKGKGILDELILRVPVMGKLLRLIDTARFSRTLADLLSAGVDIGRSLDLTADVLHLVPYQRTVRAIRRPILQGTELSTALAATGRFDPDVLAFVESGEETGSLPESLSRLADDYEERVTYMVKNLGSLIQPLIIIILGTIVGFIALAFIMAYVSVIASLAGGL